MPKIIHFSNGEQMPAVSLSEVIISPTKKEAIIQLIGNYEDIVTNFNAGAETCTFHDEPPIDLTCYPNFKSVEVSMDSDFKEVILEGI